MQIAIRESQRHLLSPREAIFHSLHQINCFIGHPTLAPHQSPQVSCSLQLQDARVFLVPPSESFSHLTLLSCLQFKVPRFMVRWVAPREYWVLVARLAFHFLPSYLHLPGTGITWWHVPPSQLHHQHYPPPLPYFTSSLSSIYSTGDPSLLKPDHPHPIFYRKLLYGLPLSTVLNGVYTWFVILSNASFLSFTYT